jgi:hypothetical protein
MKYFYFILSVLFLLGFLILLNILPLYFNRGLLREYANINELKDSLKIQKILLPAYLPEDIKWPPSRIFGQTTPHFEIILEFESNKSYDTILYLNLSEKHDFKYSDKFNIHNNSKTFHTIIKNRPATIKAGFCNENIHCSEIIIRDSRYQIILKGKMQLPILLRIAESIQLKE